MEDKKQIPKGFWFFLMMVCLFSFLIGALWGCGEKPVEQPEGELCSADEKPDSGKYDYCVEWDGWIDRENMIFNCLDIVNNTVKCNYRIDKETGMLTVITYIPDKVGEDKKAEFYCSRWLKSISIKKTVSGGEE